MKTATGYVLSRAVPRAVVQLAYGCGLVGLCTIYFSHVPVMVICGAALLGIGASPIWLFCMSAVNEENRGEQMGSVYAVWLAGLGVGPVVVNMLFDKGFGLSFLLLAIMWGMGWAVALHWDPAPLSKPDGTLRQQWGRLVRRMRKGKQLLPGMVLQTAAASLLVPVLPRFAENRLHIDYTGYAILLIFGGIGTVAFLIPMGRWADRWGHKRFIAAGFAALSILLVLLAESPNHVAVYLYAVLLGASYAAVLPAWNALLARFVPSDQKTMGWGILSGIESIGMMIGPAAGGWIAGQFHEAATVFVSALLLLSLALFYSFYYDPLENAPKHKGEIG